MCSWRWDLGSEQLDLLPHGLNPESLGLRERGWGGPGTAALTNFSLRFFGLRYKTIGVSLRYVFASMSLSRRYLWRCLTSFETDGRRLSNGNVKTALSCWFFRYFWTMVVSVKVFPNYIVECEIMPFPWFQNNRMMEKFLKWRGNLSLVMRPR